MTVSSYVHRRKLPSVQTIAFHSEFDLILLLRGSDWLVADRAVTSIWAFTERGRSRDMWLSGPLSAQIIGSYLCPEMLRSNYV